MGSGNLFGIAASSTDCIGEEGSTERSLAIQSSRFRQDKSHEATTEAERRPRDKAAASYRELRAKLDQQKYKCALTGVDLTPQSVALDHKVPVTDKGTDLIDNLQYVHPVINRMKHTLPQEEFIDWCCKVADQSRLK